MVADDPGVIRRASLGLSLGRLLAGFTLFLGLYWTYWGYGSPVLLSLGLSEKYMTFCGVLLPCIVAGVMVLHLVEKKTGKPVKELARSIAWAVVASLLVVQWMAILGGHVFTSGWNWAFDTIQEVNYLFPFWAPAMLMGVVACILLEAIGLVKMPAKDQARVGVLLASAYLPFAAYQAILVAQPYGGAHLFMLAVAVAGLNLDLVPRLLGVPSWRADAADEPVVHPAPPVRVLGMVLLLAGAFMLASMAQGQFTVLDGLFRSRAVPALVAGVLVLVLAWTWPRFTLRPSWALLTVFGFYALPITILGVSWDGSVLAWDAAMPFCMAGPLALLAWTATYSKELFARHQHGGIVVAFTTWFAVAFVFWRDPIVEFWEIEKNFGLPDSQGVYTGNFYSVYPLIPLALAACCVLLAVRWGRRSRKVPVTYKSPPRALVTSRPGKHASIVLAACVVASIAIPAFTGIALHPAAGTPQVLARADNQGVLWLASATDRVSRYHAFDTRAANLDPVITMHGARGEHELVQVVFSNHANKLQTFRSYSHGSSNVTRSGGAWIDESGTVSQHVNLTIGHVRYIEGIYDGHIADVLNPWEMLTTSEYRNHPLWLRVDIPRNATPGTFTTFCRIEFRSWIAKTYTNHQLDFAVRLVIWNATLPLQRAVETTIDFGYNAMPKAREVIDLHIAYRADVSSVSFPGVTVDLNNVSAGMSIDWTAFDEEMEHRFELGASCFALNYFPGVSASGNPQAILNGSKDAHLTAISWFYGNASVHLKSKTTPWGTTWEEHAYCRHEDEHRPEPSIMAAYNVIYGTIKNASDIRTACTLVSRNFNDFLPQLDTLDIWIASYDLWSPAVQAFIEANNKTFWTYSTQDGFPSQDSEFRDPLIMARVKGWTLFTYNIRGFLHWTYYWNHADSKTGGWGYSGMGEGYLFVPVDDDRVMPTLRVTAWRDGMEDGELLGLLAGAVETGESILGVNHPAVVAGWTALSAARATQEPQPRDLFWAHRNLMRSFDHDPATYARVRVMAGDALDTLASLLP